MRLLNVKTGILEEFWGGENPAYVILSHTWGSEEVTFADIQRFSAQRSGAQVYQPRALHLPGYDTPQAVLDQRPIESKAGYTKIKNACRQALHDGHNYIWIDTCCIDKSSSAELSEAINSMYRWYEQAAVGYAYLEDVTIEDVETSFPICRWFTRGAFSPKNLFFFDKNWTRLGTKDSLVFLISQATGIDDSTIRFSSSFLDRNSIARRMSWASKRVTTRVEDMAYCFLGIFRVNMPLLYGEGKRAFVRLQQEILKISSDTTLFAWHHDHPTSSHGVLAPSVATFADSGNLRDVGEPHLNMELNAPFMMTNRGLQIDMLLLPFTQPSGHGGQSKNPRPAIGVLPCIFDDGSKDYVGILLGQWNENDWMFRWQSNLGLQRVKVNARRKAKLRRIYIR